MRGRKLNDGSHPWRYADDVELDARAQKQRSAGNGAFDQLARIGGEPRRPAYVVGPAQTQRNRRERIARRRHFSRCRTQACETAGDGNRRNDRIGILTAGNRQRLVESEVAGERKIQDGILPRRAEVSNAIDEVEPKLRRPRGVAGQREFLRQRRVASP